MASEPVPADLVEALRGDQRRRWQAGDRVPAETYLQDHPTLRADADGGLELVYNEVVLREERGEAPQVGEYLKRFPEFADRLTPLFEVHRALESGRAGDDAPTWPGEGVTATSDLGLPDIDGYELLSPV